MDPDQSLSATAGTTLRVLPYGVMGVVAVADVTAGPGVGLLPLVSLGPAFAGLAGGGAGPRRSGSSPSACVSGSGCTTVSSTVGAATRRWRRSWA